LMSITARRNPQEFHRALMPKGWLLVALPGEDDLIELREIVLGERILRNRGESLQETFAAHFSLEKCATAHHVVKLAQASIQDVLASAYRGARHSQHARAQEVGELSVTFSRDLFWFRARP